MIQFDHMIFPCHGNCPQRKFCLPYIAVRFYHCHRTRCTAKDFFHFFSLNRWFIRAYAKGLTAELNITAVWTVGRGRNPDGRKMLQMVMIKMKIWFLKPRNSNVKKYRGYPTEGDAARSVYRGKLTLKLFYYKETYVLSIHIYYICTEIYYNIIWHYHLVKKLLAIFVTSENYRMTNHWPQTKTCTGEKNRIGFTAFHCPLSLRKTVKSRRHVYYYFVWFCSSSQSVCRYAFRPPTVNLFFNERLIAQYENVASFCYNVPVLTVLHK